MGEKGDILKTGVEVVDNFRKNNLPGDNNWLIKSHGAVGEQML